jgi:hypothetical protein
MARALIRKMVAAGLLMGGSLVVTAPAVAEVTVVQAPGLFSAFSPPDDATADFAEAGDFAFEPWTASGDWGALTASTSSAGFAAGASTFAIGEVETRFDWSLAVVFTASTPMVVSIDYERFAGAFGETVLTLVELDAFGDPAAVLWSLPTQASGTYGVTIPALSAETGRAYVFGYQEFWTTTASSSNPASGGFTVTFTAVPAPGAVAVLAAARIAASRRRRGRGTA